MFPGVDGPKPPVRQSDRSDGVAPLPGRQDRPELSSPYLLRAAALPPLRPAAFFCAVVPPCFELPPAPDFFPPRFDAPGELAILAARSLDIPLSLSASYCFSFLTLGRLSGIATSFRVVPSHGDVRPSAEPRVRRTGRNQAGRVLPDARRRGRT